MKKCPVCGRKVVSKRRDAIYCRNPRCRKEAFLARKEQSAPEPLPIGANKASVVVAFPDGSRWLMELTPLQPIAQTQLLTLTQAASLVPLHTEESAEAKTAAIDLSPATNGNGLEPIQAIDSADLGERTERGCAVASAAKVEESEAPLNGSERI